MISLNKTFVALSAAAMLFVACSKDTPKKIIRTEGGQIEAPALSWDGNVRSDITYQVLVYSFADSDGDKVGDFKGIENHLDYFSSLGVSALWLSPIHPSSSYHGYDVTDYETVNPAYGTEADFKSLLDAAHAKGIKIYLDYVLNHTASAHPWFKSAKASKDSPYRNFYIFSENPSADIAAGKIPQIATEGAKGYDSGQWFRTGTGNEMFHSHFWTDWFADLNYGPAAEAEKSDAFKALTSAADKWINLGVDGFRLDAVKHIYHNAYSSENPMFLKKFYDRCNTTFKARGGNGDFYMVGEMLDDCNKVAPYYAGLPALFEFSFWYKLKWALQNNTGLYFAHDIISMQSAYSQYRTDYIEATKLSNHDEDRAGSDLDKSKEKMKLAAAVLMTSQGHPYIYQGEELGYWGTKSRGDEYVRAPIIWDRSSTNTATAGVNGKYDSGMLTKAMSVEAQSEDNNSVLSFYRYFTKLRNAHPALASGKMSKHPDYDENRQTDKNIAAWFIEGDGEKLLVVHNFGNTQYDAFFHEDLSQAVGLHGTASAYKTADTWKLTLGAYSSAIFKQ